MVGMKWRSGFLAAVWLCVTMGAWALGGVAHTNPMNNDPQVREAYQHYYSLDYAGAVARFEHYHEQHAGDPQATDYLLNALVFEELFHQDLLDTTFYANDGFLTGRHATSENAQAKARILGLAEEAVREADWRLEKNPKDVDALFARAWARSLQCTYVAMMERGYSAGFHLANKAREDAQRALKLDPEYVDAKLIAGVYQYVVGALPLPFKLLIGIVGMTGSKSTGLAMLRDDGERGTVTSVEARTATAMFLRREARYKEAAEVVRGMKRQYPRNFLFWLEEANLRKDAGEGMGAVDAYREILAHAAKPGFYTETRLQLAYFGLGDALRGQKHWREAAEAYEHAAGTPGAGPELKVRTMLAAGECRDLLGERGAAVRDYQMAIDAGPHTTRADTARKRIREQYVEQ